MTQAVENVGQDRKTVIVVGAGIAGLTAAYRLTKAGFKVKVLEARDDVGGRAHTVHKNGYKIDTGAGAMFETYHAYMELAAELGLKSELRLSEQLIGVVKKGRIHYLNTAHILRSGLTTSLFSWGSKFRLLLAFLDIARAKRRGQLTYTDLTRAAPLDFETAEQYCLRRLNRELSEYLSEPIVRGMMLINSDRISKVELMHGINNIFDVTSYGLIGGVKRFSQTLAGHVDVHLQSPVESVQVIGDRVEVRWNEQGQTVSERVDACVMACPLPYAAPIYKEHAALQLLNRKVRFGQCITVGIGTRTRPDSKAFIVEVPRVESEDVCFMFLEHNKNTGAAPEGHGLITAYLEGNVAKQLLDKSDEDIIARVTPFIDRLFPGLSASIDMTHVTRWQAALPINAIGAYQAVADFNAALSPDAPVQFACDYMMAAVGQTIAVECGNLAARNLTQRFAKTEERRAKTALAA